MLKIDECWKDGTKHRMQKNEFSETMITHSGANVSEKMYTFGFCYICKTSTLYCWIIVDYCRPKPDNTSVRSYI